MTNKENRIYVIIFFVFTYTLFFLIIGGRVLYKYTKKLNDEKSRNMSEVVIDWEERYPYNTFVDFKQVEIENKETSKVEQISYKIKKLSTLGNNWIKVMPFYSVISKTGYIINSFFTDPSVGNSYIKTRSNYWIIAELNKVLDEKAKDKVVSYAMLQEYVESKGNDFIFIFAPSKVCAIDSQLPEGAVCYTNDNIDTYLKAMDDYSIRYVDLRKNIHKEMIDHYSMFYKTDHHWTVEAGLWAASETVKELNTIFKYSLLNPYDVGNYKMVTYPKAEFGSIGQGVTHFLAEAEDFTIPYPKFETNYRLEVPNKNIDVMGSFFDIFVDQNGINNVMKEGGGSAYGKILYGNPPYEKITNLNNSKGPKVLIIRDSFFNVVAPYFASACSELVMIDTRPDNGYFTGSIINCINEFNPDIVVAFQTMPQDIKINK